MSEKLSYGPGVTRVLSPTDRQFDAVPFIDGAPLFDCDLALLSEADAERHRMASQATLPSGFISDPTRAFYDYVFDPQWSNLLAVGRDRQPHGQGSLLWACVNGWFIPVAGTHSEGDPLNYVRLYPPPESGGRVDFVFLEVWLALLEGAPSSFAKPAPDRLWRYGNVLHGGPHLPDDLVHPVDGVPSTRRVQVQYRIRVHGRGSGRGAGVALDVYPDGLGDPSIAGQGTAQDPVSGFYYLNQADAGDPGLWRAGDGDPRNKLGTVDGYSYAVPICAVFRRNSAPYAAVVPAGNPNQGGAADRNARARLLPDPTAGSTPLSVVTLRDLLVAGAGKMAPVSVRVAGLPGSGLEDLGRGPLRRFVVVDQEIMEVTAADPVAGTLTVTARGRWATADSGHLAGAVVKLFDGRPDGVYADQVRAEDVLDLRHAVARADWDYGRLLESAVASLINGTLRSTWKRCAPGDVEGAVVHEVSYLQSDILVAVPNQTEALDGPDGIRTVWSDAASPQPFVTMLLDNEATTNQNGVGLSTADQFDTTTRWDLGADFKPTGFLNVARSGIKAFTNGSMVFIHLGGENGSEGARGTFRDAGTRAVRFVSPREAWRSDDDPKEVGNQEPVWARFLGMRTYESPPTGTVRDPLHPGPMAPSRRSGFERPYLFLGGLLHPSLRVSVPASGFRSKAGRHEIDLGINFDVDGVYYSTDAVGGIENIPEHVSRPLARGRRTLLDMLTAGGRDRTGSSSEVYLIGFGDSDSLQNNGAFRVVGVGTVGLTLVSASNATSVVVEPLSTDFAAAGFDSGTKNTLTVEVRSQECNSDDMGDYSARIGDAALVFTDLGGMATDHRWSAALLKSEAPQVDVTLGRVAVARKLLVDLTLLYHPGRGGTARVADRLVRFALRSGGGRDQGGYLQQDPAEIDRAFSAEAGVPAGEVPFRFSHVQTWNNLSSLGLPAPVAPAYGGAMAGGTEVEREGQLLVDLGSKTIVFRPMRRRELTMHAVSYDDVLPAGTCLLGPYAYPNGVPKDGLQLWTGTPTSGKRSGVPIPPEITPRFGRLDIPYYRDVQAGRGPFLSGINHLFLDGADPTDPTFMVIGGGRDNTSGGAEATLMHFSTGGPTTYGTSATILGVINPLPNVAARKTTRIDPNVKFAKDILAALRAVGSSDAGRGLRGIQLPPYYGVCRLLGVYERNDFIGKGGRTFRRDRVRVEDDPATNLLREDAQVQTLFLFRDGAKDLTQETGDHTYIIPEGTLDLTRIPGWVPGRGFDDFDYVVVATIFGFARGFVSQNSLVLLRAHDGAGRAQVDTQPQEIEGIKTVIPCPAGEGDHLYAAFDRTPYQGDPYGTRGVTSRVTGDYEHRLGEIPPQLQREAHKPIQQQDEFGNPIPEVPNARAFQVLAALDFYTTLGTGKIGGRVWPGTLTDAGHTEATPEAADRYPPDPARGWRIEPSTFTLRQSRSSSRATALIDVLDNNALEAACQSGWCYAILFHGPGVVGPVGLFLTTTEFAPSIRIRLFAAPTDLVIIDQAGRTEQAQQVVDKLNFGTLGPAVGALSSPEVAVDASQMPALLELPPTRVPVAVAATLTNFTPPPYGGVVLTGRRDKQKVYLQAHYLASAQALLTYPTGNVRTFPVGFAAVAPGAFDEKEVTWFGASPAKKSVCVVAAVAPLAPGLLVSGYVTAAGTVRLRLTNLTAAPVTLPAQNFVVALLEEPDVVTWQVNLSVASALVSLSWERGDRTLTAQALSAAISAHPRAHLIARATWGGGSSVRLEAEEVGAAGNATFVEATLLRVETLTSDEPFGMPDKVLGIRSPRPAWAPDRWTSTGAPFRGAEDEPSDAGSGVTQVSLGGITERLPLGLLVQDSDFLGESPLRDDSSSLRGGRAGLGSVQRLLPLADGGLEYDRSLGAPGELFGMGDGSILQYTPYSTDVPTGSRRFRLYRGGGSLFVLHGVRPGGPVEWSSGSWPPALRPVLKGAVLVSRAFLVRAFREEAFNPSPYVTTYGDEIQMIVATYAVFGDGSTTQVGVKLGGQISPSGYGEGFAAADRFRLPAHPLYRGGHDRAPLRLPSGVRLAPLSQDDRFR